VESLHKYESLKGVLEGIVVGELLSCEKHPDANIGAVEPS
jgi:phenylalanyl-tRNA synthetase beta chain